MTLALMSSLVAFAIPMSAQAQQPLPVRSVGSLMPNDQFSAKAVLSDAFDGVDNTAHLTAVADPRATQATWFVCAADSSSAQVGTGSCTTIGTDTDGVQALPADQATFQQGSLRAFEFDWDIPSNLDRTNVTIIVRACNGAPSTQVGTNNVPTNCLDDVEGSNGGVTHIVLDDSASSGAGTPAQFGAGRDLETGEITGICTNTANNCLPATLGGTGTGTYTSGAHGSQTIPANGAFTARFRTRTEVTNAGACLSNFNTASGPTGNAELNPLGCFGGSEVAATRVTPTGSDTFSEWFARVGATGSATDELNLDLAVYGTGPANSQTGTIGGACGTTFGTGGTGGANACVFDEHYFTGIQAVASQVVATFNNAATYNGANLATCSLAPRLTVVDRLGDTEVATVCVADSQGNPVDNANVTFESRGVGTLTCNARGTTTANITATTTPAGTTSDALQRCSVLTNTDGRASATLTNTNTDPPTTGNTRANGSLGDQVITACRDLTPATTARPVGCADESAIDVAAAITKTWVAVPTHVHLVYAGTGDAGDPCHTGDAFKVNQVGDNDTLLACVFDSATVQRPASTAGVTGEATGGFVLTWDFGGATCNAVGFTGNPPGETDANGQGTVTIRAIAQGSCTLRVTLGGTLIANTTATVTKSVEAATEPDPIPRPGPGQEAATCSTAGQNTRTPLQGGGFLIVGTDGDDSLVGSPGDDIICGLAGNDAISGKGGDDILMGQAGNDTIRGGGGRDDLRGGGGRDVLAGNKGNDVLRGGGGRDTLRGNAGRDTLVGGGGPDTLRGGKGSNDIMRGGKGADTLNDLFGRGNVFNGGPGRDTCIGKRGARNVFRSCETRRLL